MTHTALLLLEKCFNLVLKFMYFYFLKNLLLLNNKVRAVMFLSMLQLKGVKMVIVIAITKHAQCMHETRDVCACLLKVVVGLWRSWQQSQPVQKNLFLNCCKIQIKYKKQLRLQKCKIFFGMVQHLTT